MTHQYPIEHLWCRSEIVLSPLMAVGSPNSLLAEVTWNSLKECHAARSDEEQLYGRELAAFEVEAYLPHPAGLQISLWIWPKWVRMVPFLRVLLRVTSGLTGFDRWGTRGKRRPTLWINSRSSLRLAWCQRGNAEETFSEGPERDIWKRCQDRCLMQVLIICCVYFLWWCHVDLIMVIYSDTEIQFIEKTTVNIHNILYL